MEKGMQEYLREFGNEHQFPQEAMLVLTEAYEKIVASDQGRKVWDGWMQAYEQDVNIDYRKAMEELRKQAGQAQVHEYTSDLLLFMGFSRWTEKLYEKRGISRQIFHDSMEDLRWKLWECWNMYHVWGSFVAWWFQGFFDLTRFTLGRLEFELIPFPEDYEKAGEGRKKPLGMKQVVNMHIPSSGPLTMQDCEKSFAQALTFFKEAAADGQMGFVCSSWLLYPENKKILPASSNIAAFLNLFDIYQVKEDKEGGDLWRIFGQEYDGNPESLKDDTTLRRQYKKFLQDGGVPGYGEGIFFMRQE